MSKLAFVIWFVCIALPATAVNSTTSNETSTTTWTTTSTMTTHLTFSSTATLTTGTETTPITTILANTTSITTTTTILQTTFTTSVSKTADITHTSTITSSTTTMEASVTNSLTTTVTTITKSSTPEVATVTNTGTMTMTETLTSTFAVEVTVTQIEGSMTMTASNPDAFIQNEDVKTAIAHGLAETVGVSAEHIVLTLSVARRLRSRQLNQAGTIVVDYVIKTTSVESEVPPPNTIEAVLQNSNIVATLKEKVMENLPADSTFNIEILEVSAPTVTSEVITRTRTTVTQTPGRVTQTTGIVTQTTGTKESSGPMIESEACSLTPHFSATYLFSVIVLAMSMLQFC